MGAIIKKTNPVTKKKYTDVLYLDQLLPQAGGSIFSLVRVAMIRALELDSGRPALIEHAASDKPTTVALKEIVQGKVVLKNKESMERKDREMKREDVAASPIIPQIEHTDRVY